MAKAKDAFRTISEVAEWLETPTHVLRFWESKFSQIKPVKGAGGRRYYRPTDMDLLGGIKQLLHEDGLTIKGTQKLLREKGVKYVATLGRSVTEQAPEEQDAVEKTVAPKVTKAAKPAPEQPIKQPESAKPAPEPAEPMQNALPFDDLPKKAPEIILRDLPADDTPAPARFFTAKPIDAAAVRAKSAEIVPLLQRLEQLSDHLRRGAA